MKNQFEIIRPWIPHVLQAIKKDIRTEHLPASPAFARAHFGTRPLNRLVIEEIFKAYETDLLAGNEEIAEWVVNRWVFRHGDVYSHFAERLGQIDANYDSLSHLSEEQSEQVLEGASERFGHLAIYLFSVLNRVVFPESVFDRLRSAAEKEEASQKAHTQEMEERQTMEQIIARHQREIARLQEKYEGKILGLMKKYDKDVHSLKQQVRSLQKNQALHDRTA